MGHWSLSYNHFHTQSNHHIRYSARTLASIIYTIFTAIFRASLWQNDLRELNFRTPSLVVCMSKLLSRSMNFLEITLVLGRTGEIIFLLNATVIDHAAPLLF